MRAYEAKALERIQLEESKWIEVGEVVTVTPDRNLNEVIVWMGGSLYFGVDGRKFEQTKIISES